MKNKIELFQELFASDPTSKVFYPLAKLYAESGMLIQAGETLRQGLSRHPDHMEARLLFIDILHQMERDDQALEEVETLAGLLSKYPSFWALWADRAGERSKDAAVALNFLSAHLGGRDITWADVLLKGFEAITGRLPLEDDLLDFPAPRPAAAPEPVASAPERHENTDFTFEAAEEEGGDAAAVPDEAAAAAADGEGNLRTRTMAELLVSQGDYAGALEILRELSGRATGLEKGHLQKRIEEVKELRASAPAEEPAEKLLDEADFISGAPMQRAKNKLVRSLSLLAERLEARAGA
ncbi:hypothetical protein dsx2_0151 [Desulfovibrio sp. X2]|uniref:tetratricopeptide repeat protein n=1 Tax=Desulfovibrio sp. X2 TaxID=941449 RepID=UPI0003587C91|nr:tetratricopeptide repeat protein [Desulfovibrio sp. X2]EPR42224.1 hypothetical protein dsx2_0151 [Desulfovibrio sp. X2]